MVLLRVKKIGTLSSDITVTISQFSEFIEVVCDPCLYICVVITVYHLLSFPLEVFIRLQTCVTVWNSLSVSCHFHFQVGQAALFVFGCASHCSADALHGA